MGKTRDLFQKIRDTKGTFHAKMGSLKDRNAMDLKEAEDIKKRWQEYTEELYKKDLHDPDAEYIMRNAGLEETQAGIKSAGRNINNLRYTDDTALWQKVKEK